MKKFILLTSLCVIGFANANTMLGNNDLSTLENETNCTHITLSCGIEYDICNFKGTTSQLVQVVINANNSNCSTEIIAPKEDHSLEP